MEQYIGALIRLGFGFGWAAAGSLGLRNHWRPLMLAVSVIATVAVAFALLHARAMAPPAPFQHAHWQIYSVTVVAEVIAIVISAMLLTRRGKRSLIMPVTGIIVGAHFVVLWAATVYTQPAFLFAAASMIAICALALRLAEPGRTVWTGLGSGWVLMLAAESVLA
jgi:hypothetical protein